MSIFIDFCEHLESNGIEFIPRHGNHEAWNQQFERLSYQPIEYGSQNIDYQHEYMSENSSKLIDLSFIILSGGKISGLWVLTAAEINNKLTLTSCGKPILAPLFFDSCTRKSRKRFCSAAIKVISTASKIGFNGALSIQQGPFGNKKDSAFTEWYKQAIQLSTSISVKHELYVDLSLSVNEIRSFYRKSYKPFINKGLREWHYNIYEEGNIDKKKWKEFKDFHLKVSGRITRNNLTWDKQYQMIKLGQAFLITLHGTKDGKLVGCGFFQHTKDEGMYAVAAYDRTLFNKPLGHVVQQAAIEHMKTLGLKWYKLGDRLYANNSISPSKKEIDISIFKEGFSTNMMPRFELKLSTV